MMCERCGGEHFRVVSTVKRTPQGDLREVQCTFCKQLYDTLDVITHAVKRDPVTTGTTRVEISTFKEQVLSGLEKVQPSLRLSLLE